MTDDEKVKAFIAGILASYACIAIGVIDGLALQFIAQHIVIAVRIVFSF